MSVWPDVFTPGLNRGTLSPSGETPIGDLQRMAGINYSNVTTTWTANRAVYQPVKVEIPITVTQMAVKVVTQNGNLDVGIYDWENTLLVSLGSTGVGAAGIQVCNIADTLLAPGWYKMGFACNSGTAVFAQSTHAAIFARACGVQEQTSSAFPLPGPATPIAYATAIMPYIMAAYRTGP